MAAAPTTPPSTPAATTRESILLVLVLVLVLVYGAATGESTIAGASTGVAGTMYSKNSPNFQNWFSLALLPTHGMVVFSPNTHLVLWGQSYFSFFTGA